MSRIVQLDGIHMDFDNKALFRDFNLDALPGEKVALKGSSGSGKTTLLKIIMGYEFPEKGTVSVFNQSLNRSSIREIRSKCSWLPQNFNILGSGTVESIIMTPFSFNNNKELKPEKKEIVDLMEALGFNRSFLDKNFEELSGGEKQRIGLIIMKLLRRPLALLDEPTSALDKDSITRAAGFILSEKEMTVISASHNQEWLDRCDRIIELNKGAG